MPFLRPFSTSRPPNDNVALNPWASLVVLVVPLPVALHFADDEVGLTHFCEGAPRGFCRKPTGTITT